MNYEQQSHLTSLLGQAQNDHDAKRTAMIKAIADEN
jgi:hypothetical protein